MTGFIYGGDTGLTAEDLRRQREVAQSMLKQGAKPGATISEAMTNLGSAIFGNLAARRAEKEWKQKNSAAWSPIAAALAGPKTVTEPATGQSMQTAAPELTPDAMFAAMGSGYLDPAQQAIVQSMLGRQFQMKDREAQWSREDQRRAEDRQWQLQNRPARERRIVTGADGFLYYADSGERVLPNVQAQSPQPMSPEQKAAWGLPPDAPYVLEKGVPKLLSTPTATKPQDSWRAMTPEETAQYGVPSGQINEATGQVRPINPPSGMQMQVNPDGTVSFAQGAGVGNKPLTESQSKDVVYATRAEGALPTLEAYAGSMTNFGDKAMDMDPTGLVRGNFQDPDYQVAKAAGDEFLQAVLRKDTGAAITQDEQTLYGRTYLPQPGDGARALKYKKEARRRAIDAMKAGMPPAAIVAQERALGMQQGIFENKNKVDVDGLLKKYGGN